MAVTNYAFKPLSTTNILIFSASMVFWQYIFLPCLAHYIFGILLMLPLLWVITTDGLSLVVCKSNKIKTNLTMVWKQIVSWFLWERITMEMIFHTCGLVKSLV